MQTEEVSLKQLLEKSRQQLTKPLTKTRRRLLLSVNVTYLCLVVIFLGSEKLATGRFVPHDGLAIVYSLVAGTNLLTAIHTFRLLRAEANGLGLHLGSERTELRLRWLSIGSIMLMSFCNMAGVGNPSHDSILTDFALGHSLIVLSAMLLGRPASLGWTIVVLGLLLYMGFVDVGYTYQYNYLTPAESQRYEQGLQQHLPWALQRQATLQANGLNPPTVSRYVNVWFVFILVAFLTAYFCLDTTLSMFKVVPTVTHDIREAIDASNRQAQEREWEKRQAEEQKLLLRQEALSAELKTLKAQLNPHFLYNTLNYFYIKASDVSEDLADAILKLSDIMRYTMQDNLTQVNLAEEINYLEQFIALHQLRNGNQLCIDFSVTGPVADKVIIPFLYIGLVENSFKHGRLNDPANPLIIRIDATNASISFFTRNLKNKKQRFASNNIGLTNMRRRLYLTYPDRYQFDVSQDDNMFSCQLIIQD
ncbi:hypothetical protein GCM10027578_04960 [Spirosoma luteolum]